MESHHKTEKVINCQAEYDKPVPNAHELSQSVYDACFREVPKPIKVPLMKIGENYVPPQKDGATVLSSDGAIARLYMDARQSMGKIKAPDGSTGTGFFLNKDGLFATDYHVVKEFPFVNVLTDDGKVRRAMVLGKDVAEDVALLKVEKNARESFKPVDLTAPSQLDEGEKLLSCGFAGNSELHCSPGLYSKTIQQKDIVMDPPAPFLNPQRKVALVDQHTEKGDSGGPVFLLKNGRVGFMIDLTGVDGAHAQSTVVTPIEKLIALSARIRP